MQIKKTALLIFITTITFLFINISLGEYSIIEENSGYKKIEIPFPERTLETNKINYIDTKFCNDGIQQEKLTQNLSMVIRPGEKKEICMVHFNSSEEDIYVSGSFPENQIYPNGNSDCSTDNTRNNPFSKFIQPLKNELIKVPAKGYVITKTTIKFPKGINGLQRGCYAYSANQGNREEGNVLSIVTRKVRYIDVLVQGYPYTVVEILKDIIIQNKNISVSILFIIILILLILEIKKIKSKKHV